MSENEVRWTLVVDVKPHLLLDRLPMVPHVTSAHWTTVTVEGVSGRERLADDVHDALDTLRDGCGLTEVADPSTLVLDPVTRRVTVVNWGPVMDTREGLIAVVAEALAEVTA